MDAIVDENTENSWHRIVGIFMAEKMKDILKKENRLHRRAFLGGATASVAVLHAPFVHAEKRTVATRRDEVVIGKGDYLFRADHRVVRLPDKYHWQFTHNIAIDSANNIYVMHEGEAKLKDHPAIFVFDPDGKFIRAFGNQFQGGGHGLDIRKEGSEDFLYVTGYQQVKSFAKMTTSGEMVWYKKAPMVSGVYSKGQDTSTKASWSRKGFLPTNFAFLENGEFLLADGYGSYFIHHFDKDANWVKCFGGPGDGQGTFDLSHGLCVDRRPERKTPSLLVTDRNRNSLQRLTLNGDYIETIANLMKPCSIDTYENQLLITEYVAALSILDERSGVLVRLDEGVERLQNIKNLRQFPSKWRNGHFINPHDACFDKVGNILVAERIPTGRITKLSRVS